MAWKPGDKAYVYKWGMDPSHPSHIDETVTVLAADCGGYMSIKVRNSSKEVFYVRPSWIRKPNRAVNPRKDKSIRQKAARMAEERMQQLMDENKLKKDENKPTFEEVATWFAAVNAVAGTSEKANIVADLALESIHQKITNGVK